MSAWLVASTTFLLTFGGAVLGTFIRSWVPASHASKESHDVVRLGMGLVATMTAVLLGLVLASAKGSFDAQDVIIKNSAVNLLTLDRHLARYGPEARPIRDQLRKLVEARTESTWPTRGVRRTVALSQTTGEGEAIQNQILALKPETESQRWFKSQALFLSEDVLRNRWRLLQAGTSTSVPTAFMVVVVLWLMMTFVSFGLNAPQNATVLTSLLVAALSVSAAIFLILGLGTPYEGLIRVSGRPFQFLLTQLGK